MTLDEIYAQIPRLECKGKCQESCSAIALFPAEVVRISPHGLPTTNNNLQCSKLTIMGCSIYRDRPLICRLFGVVKKMRCPFGCIPEQWLTDAEAQNLMKQVDQLKPGLPYSTLNPPR